MVREWRRNGGKRKKKKAGVGLTFILALNAWHNMALCGTDGNPMMPLGEQCLERQQEGRWGRVPLHREGGRLVLCGACQPFYIFDFTFRLSFHSGGYGEKVFLFCLFIFLMIF